MSVTGTAVQARIPTLRLVSLTNPNDTTATTVNTTVLELAVDDVTAEFVTLANETYDASNARHLALAVRGVPILLSEWLGQGQGPGEQNMESWRGIVREYARTANRARVSPQTNITYAPTILENQGRPVFDPSRFDRQTLSSPPSSDDED